MSRSVFLGAPVDTPWDDEDRTWALALLAVERSTCTCGEPLAESHDPVNEFGYTAEVLRCHACAAIDRARDALPETADLSGIRIHAKRKGAR